MRDFGHLANQVEHLPDDAKKNVLKVITTLVKHTEFCVRDIKKKRNAGSLEILQLAVMLAEQAVTQVLNGQKLPCTKGCTYCCYLMVEVFDHEVYGIVAYLMETRSISELQALYTQLVLDAKKSSGASAMEYLELKLPCVFLQDGACSIYPARPVACVTYHSLDKEACVTVHEHTDQPWIPQVAEIIVGVPAVSLGVLNVIDPGFMKSERAKKQKSLPERLAPVLRDRVNNRYGVTLE